MTGVNLIKDMKNDLLKRREVLAVFNEESNPGLAKSGEIIVSKLKVSAEKVVIKSVKNNFGANEFVIEAFIYDSKEDKEKTEPKIKVKKKMGAV